MNVPIANFRESKFPIATDPYGGNLKSIANEPSLTEALSGSLPRDILIVHRDPKPITEERFAELINHFDGEMRSDSPLSAYVQIGKHHNARVNIKLGDVLEKGATTSSQAVLASFSEGVTDGVRSSITGAIHRSLELLSERAESFYIIPDQKLPSHKLVRALRSTGWAIESSYFQRVIKATLNQRNYRVVAHIPKADNVGQIGMTFLGDADGEHARFYNVKMQNLVRGIYSAIAKDEERQPLLATNP